MREQTRQSQIIQQMLHPAAQKHRDCKNQKEDQKKAKLEIFFKYAHL